MKGKNLHINRGKYHTRSRLENQKIENCHLLTLIKSVLYHRYYLKKICNFFFVLYEFNIFLQLLHIVFHVKF
jgi:hypothetical protein